MSGSQFGPKVGGAAFGNAGSIVVIDPRPLIGQCFIASLKSAEPSLRTESFLSIATWQGTAAVSSADVVLLCLPGGHTPEKELEQIEQALTQLHDWDSAMPIAVMSDCESAEQIVQVLKLGIKGYIPTSASLEVAAQALQLIQAGGIYMPATCMMGVLAGMDFSTSRKVENLPFSPRQLSVARALRKGTPNKIIAYELNMCESTVKVHVREIMKKLKAKNRTEIAYLTNRYFNAE